MRKEVISLDRLDEIEGWLSRDVMLLLQGLVKKMPLDCDALEVGSWKGKSSLTIASVLTEKQSLHCIDTFEGSQEHDHLYGKVNTLKEFIDNIENFGLSNKIQIHKGKSEVFSTELANKKLGLVFIDGSHEYLDVLKDFKIWFPLLEINGWMAFHDAKWPGVRKVIWEEIYPLKRIGRVKRIEDTIYFQKQKKSYRLAFLLNQLTLKKEQLKQSIKRKKRKIRKNWSAFFEKMLRNL